MRLGQLRGGVVLIADDVGVVFEELTESLVPLVADDELFPARVLDRFERPE